MSLWTRGICGVFCASIGGCGDVAALAEPPVEPTAWADDAGGYSVAGAIAFADGLRVGTRVFTGVVPVVTSVHVQFPVSGLTHGTALQVGVRAPRAAGRQVVAGQSRNLVAEREDPRDRWVTATVDGDVATAELEIADGWHPLHAVVVLRVLRGDDVVMAVAGPRHDRGDGVLGVVPVATRPTQVIAGRGTPVIDGVLDDAVWAGAGTRLVTSLEGEPDPSEGTRVWLAWDEQFLYAAASLPDVDLWTEYLQQDDPLYKQEAFELFVAGGGDGTRYLEFQVSARGVTFDAKFLKYRAGDEGWDSGWRTAVRVDGTLTAGDRDRGWTTEVAVPWTELCEYTAIVCPPAVGMRVRVNAFRLERPDRKRTDALALSPTRAPDFHAWANAAELELR